MILLSILIPTLPDRVHFFNELKSYIISTCPKEYKSRIEVLDDPRPRSGEPGGVTTGEKRNDLDARAIGKYIWRLDDDDMLYPYSMERVLRACETGVDVIGINGIMTTDGVNEQGWEIRLGHPFQAIIRDGKEYYLRFPNHITPMLREHAVKIKFPNKTIFEDYHYACALRDAGLLKTQTIIEEPVYHYRVRSKK